MPEDKVVKKDTIKLIYYKPSSEVNIPDDPSLPFQLEVLLWPLELSDKSSKDIRGSERVVMKGATRKVLNDRIKLEKWRKHPRLIHLVLSGPDNKIIEDLWNT